MEDPPRSGHLVLAAMGEEEAPDAAPEGPELPQYAASLAVSALLHPAVHRHCHTGVCKDMSTPLSCEPNRNCSFYLCTSMKCDREFSGDAPNGTHDVPEVLRHFGWRAAKEALEPDAELADAGFTASSDS